MLTRLLRISFKRGNLYPVLNIVPRPLLLIYLKYQAGYENASIDITDFIIPIFRNFFLISEKLLFKP